MKQTILFGVLAAGLLLSAGCRTKEDFSRLGEEIPPLATEAVREKRLADFRQAWGDLPVRAIQTNYQQLSPFAKMNPKRWLTTLSKMGCNRLVITVRPETNMEWPSLRAVALEAAEQKIQLFFELEQKAYVLPFRGNQLIRHFNWWYQSLSDKCREIRDFDLKLPDKAKISGIILTAQPDYFTDYNLRERPKDLLFSWSADRYGIGGSNDAIMQYTMQHFRECINDASPKHRFVIGMPDFTHDAVHEKQLSVGSVADFVKLGKNPDKEVILNLLVKVQSGKTSRVDVSGVDQELADGGGKVIVGVDIARHQAVSDGALPRQNWNGMCRITKYCVRNWRKKSCFHGLVIGPWTNIASMLGEQ